MGSEVVVVLRSELAVFGGQLSRRSAGGGHLICGQLSCTGHNRLTSNPHVNVGLVDTVTSTAV